MVVIINTKECFVKVSFDLRNEKPKNKQEVSFEAYKFTKSADGVRELEVSCPYDQNKDNCYIEIYKVDKDTDGNYFTTARAYSKKGADKLQLQPGANRIDLYNTFGIEDNQAFAYHFVLEDKNKGWKRTLVDAGDVIDEHKDVNGASHIFNVVTPTKSDLSRGGSMKLVIIDSQKVGYVYNDKNMIVEDKTLKQRGLDGIKTITNKYGGTLAGLEQDIEDGAYAPYRRIISLPVFTDDDFSAHAYWNKNCMQMASSLGNINNYASLQRKMFAHGLNFVSDGAFVNEGLEGIHFKNMLRWGENSPYFYWFKAGNLKDNPLSLGIFSKNKEFIGVKLVNHPKNSQYDAKRPTYIQFYDKRLVTPLQINDKQNLIESYKMKMSVDNVYQMHTHNDSIYPYAFEINPETYDINLERLKEYNRINPHKKINLDSYIAARFLSKAENYNVDGKFESGFETWDANPDIAKLNFAFSYNDVQTIKNLPMNLRKAEEEKILRGNYQVQDYAVTSGQYWTQKTDDILRLYTAQLLKNPDAENPQQVYDNIQNISDNKILPQSIKAEVSKEEVENVLIGAYNNKRKLSNGDKKAQILEGLMNTPLDTFEFGDNLTAVLASPLISKRASVKSDIGLSRYEVYQNGNKNLPEEYRKTYNMMDKIYEQEMSKFALKILNAVDEQQKPDRKLFNGDEVTTYGKYVLPLLLPEIAKFAAVKTFAPKVKVTVNEENGEIAYDYKALKQTHLETIGVKKSLTPEDEAIKVLTKLKTGIPAINANSQKQLVEALSKSLAGTNLASFQLADLIIDKTQSGLDWRIDAAKDIADVQALRAKKQDFEKTWQTIIDFWKSFNDGVLSKNPNSYIVAEVTDKDDLHNHGYGGNSSKFHEQSSILKKFFRETGMSAKAQYSFIFNDLPMMFAQNSETGKSFDTDEARQKKIYEIFNVNNGNYLRNGTLDSIIYAYTFIGNHDKPRALHAAALDMNFFYTNLNDVHNFNYRKKAFQIVNDRFDEVNNPIKDHEVNHFNYADISPKAMAMADVLRPAFVNILNQHRDKFPTKEAFDKAYIPISKAISDLAQGKFVDGSFDPDAFGIKPIDINVKMVLKQAKKVYGFELPAELEKTYENEVFEAVMKPALSKVLAMMKYLVALPGTPTLFDGDDKGATGYETKTKNIYLQCRQRIHDEWVEEGNPAYKEYIAKYKKYFDDVMAVRTNPKCNALNNGDIHLLPLQESQNKLKVPAILRLSTDGRMALSLFNTSALHSDYRVENEQQTIYVDKVYLNGDGCTEGIAGMREGTKFVNANDENDIYFSRVKDGQYYIVRHCNGKDVPIMIKDSTLILYHVPENNPPLTFTGSYHKPAAKFVTNAYSNTAKKLQTV